MPVSRLQAKACTLARAPNAALDLALRLIAQCTICRASSVLKPMARIFISTFALAFVASIPTKHVNLRGGHTGVVQALVGCTSDEIEIERTSFHVCAPRSRAYLDEAAYVIMQLASCKRSHLAHPRYVARSLRP